MSINSEEWCEYGIYIHELEVDDSVGMCPTETPTVPGSVPPRVSRQTLFFPGSAFLVVSRFSAQTFSRSINSDR